MQLLTTVTPGCADFVLFLSVARTQTGVPQAEVLVKPSTLAVSADPPAATTSSSSTSDGGGGMSALPIIVGAVGVVLIAAACCCWRRRRRKHDSQEPRRDVEVSNETHTNENALNRLHSTPLPLFVCFSTMILEISL